MGKNLSKLSRRLGARGFNIRDKRYIGGRYHAGIGNRATLATALTGTNNDLLYMAKVPGTAGNAYTIRYVVAGASTPLTVSVASGAVTVNVQTNSGSTAISTASEVEKALRASAAFNAILHVNRVYGDDGSGVITAMAATNLAGATTTPAY